MADLAVANSTYQTGDQDTASTLVNNVSATDAQQWNGTATACVQIETILGRGSDLKGSAADLVARLAVLLNSNGTLRLTGFTGLTTDYGLLAVSSTEMALRNHTPIGVFLPYGGTTAPPHWLMCDGSAVSRTTYAKLFAVIGTAYGSGDGSSTFNVPDLRGRVPIGVDGSANRITSASTGGSNADTLGGTGGAETHTLTTAEMPAHSHSLYYDEQLIVVNTGELRRLVGTTDSYSTDSTGGGGAHSNTQPWQTANYIIFAGV